MISCQRNLLDVFFIWSRLISDVLSQWTEDNQIYYHLLSVIGRSCLCIMLSLENLFEGVGWVYGFFKILQLTSDDRMTP